VFLDMLMGLYVAILHMADRKDGYA
jgi:hypothetical protein